MAMMMSNWVDKNLNAYRIDVECAAATTLVQKEKVKTFFTILKLTWPHTWIDQGMQIFRTLNIFIAFSK